MELKAIRGFEDAFGRGQLACPCGLWRCNLLDAKGGARPNDVGSGGLPVVLRNQVTADQHSIFNTAGREIEYPGTMIDSYFIIHNSRATSITKAPSYKSKSMKMLLDEDPATVRTVSSDAPSRKVLMLQSS